MSSRRANTRSDSILVIASPRLTPVEILKLGKFTDVSLVCGDSKIRAHKCVLASSRYFEEFFKRDKTCTEMVMHIDFEDLKCIVLFMYQGRIVIPMERRTSLIKCARMFGVPIEDENILILRNGFEKSFGDGEALLFVFID